MFIKVRDNSNYNDIYIQIVDISHVRIVNNSLEIRCVNNKTYTSSIENEQLIANSLMRISVTNTYVNPYHIVEINIGSLTMRCRYKTINYNYQVFNPDGSHPERIEWFDEIVCYSCSPEEMIQQIQDFKLTHAIEVSMSSFSTGVT